MTDAAARALFEEYKSRGFALIEEQLKSGAEEWENLDFKICNSDGASLHKDDKKNFAELASAFANTSGGVLVWGVDCRKNDEEIDVVTELKPFAKVAAFRSALKTNAPSLLQPGLNGIDFHIIMLPNENDKGFLVVFIPSAQGEPVRAEAARTYRYHIRTGDQSPVMPHSILADRFGRRPHPKLELRWWQTSRQKQGKGIHLEIMLAVYNAGRGIARYPMVRLHSWLDKPGVQIAEDQFRALGFETAFKANPIDAREYFWIREISVIQPGIYFDFTRLLFDIEDGTTSIDWELPYTLQCEGDRHDGVLKITTGLVKAGEIYASLREP